MTDPNDPLVRELADARERISELERQAERQALAAQTPEQREEALRQAEGQALLEAIHRAQSKNALPSAFVEAFGGGQGRS